MKYEEADWYPHWKMKMFLMNKIDKSIYDDWVRDSGRRRIVDVSFEEC